MHSHVGGCHCTKFDDVDFNSFRGIPCEEQTNTHTHTHTQSGSSTLKLAKVAYKNKNKKICLPDFKLVLKTKLRWGIEELLKSINEMNEMNQTLRCLARAADRKEQTCCAHLGKGRVNVEARVARALWCRGLSLVARGVRYTLCTSGARAAGTEVSNHRKIHTRQTQKGLLIIN